MLRPISLSGCLRLIRSSSVALALGWSGCVTNAIVTTAKTVGDGVDEVLVAPGVNGVKAPKSTNHDRIVLKGARPAQDTTVPVWSIEAGYRRGFGKSFDFGVGLNTGTSVRVDGKLNLFDTRYVALSVDPAIGGTLFWETLRGEAAVLFDIAPVDSVRLTFAPKYCGFLMPFRASNDAHSAYTLGGTAGVEFRVSAVVALQPYFGWDSAPEEFLRSGFFNGGLAVKLRPNAGKKAKRS